MIGINVTLSDEQIEKIAAITADKVLYTNKVHGNNQEWYDQEIKELKDKLAKRDYIIVERDIYINRLKERIRESRKLLCGVNGTHYHDNLNHIHLP